MGGHVSPRVAYWTSAFEPEMEAIASEVALLRRHFRHSIAWGLSHLHWVRLSLGRGYCLHPRLQAVFRVVTRVLEPAFQINHVFGSLGDWYYLESRKRRPTVLTVAAAYPPVEAALLRRVNRFVVEYPGGLDFLASHGIPGDRVRLILPPVDLRRFVPAPAPEGPFTALFASSPDKETWLDARGVPQILDAAQRRPQMIFRLLWRPWGDSEPRVRQWIAERGLHNVELIVGRSRDMARHYRAAHVVLAPFTDLARSKPAPNSVIESLACGRPALVTEAVGLADLVRAGHAGYVAAPTGEALAEGLDRVRADWDHYAREARALAERAFGVERFVQAYRQLYEEVLAA
jgi:glycosyltransferase involved in cell wall biosynthesis